MANGPASPRTRHLRTLFALGAAGSLTDGQLLERFATLDGDPAELAFAALVERHGPMVLRVARSTLVDEPSAHDAFQATFLIFARKARSLWVRDSLGPWLHAVAFRVASRSRALEARRRRHERAASRPEAHEPRDGSRDDLARAIHEEVERLPEPYRAAIVTCHLEGLTQQDAARRLGWPVGTLQSRLARGRQRLRDRLKRRGLAPSLGLLAVKLAPVPNVLVASTAKAAATLNSGGTIAGMIAPTVLAMIHTTTKGMLMTKLKLGAVALVMACGLVGSGIGLGVGRGAKATEGPVVEIPQAKPGKVDANAPTATLEPVPAKWRSRGEAPPPSSDGPVLPPLADPLTDIRPPSFPTMLYFYADWAGPCRQSRQEVDRLARQRYPITSVNIDGPSELVDRYHVTAVPTYILVDDSGRELGRTAGAMPASKLAEFYNETWRKSPKPDRPNEEPALTNHSNPKPWETVVRIKIHLSDEEWGFGSGTIISSSAEESIVLTCAHIFRVKGQQQPSPKNFHVPISVDLFGGQFVRPNPATLACTEKDIPGEAIDYDFTKDVGLIRIRPGRQLPASRVVPAWWKPEKGMRMYTVGCSHGQDATAWDTTILDPRVGMTNAATKESFAVIKCAHQPKEGRTGGGLYTTDGYVAGVCDFADPNEHVGLYAVPESIHALLDRNELSSVYASKATDGSPPGSVDSKAPAIVQGGPRVEDVDLHGRKYPAPPSLLDEGGRATASPARLEPVPPRVVSDQGRRLDDLERKLDQVLKALEDLKGDTALDQRNVHPPNLKRQ